MMMVHLLEEISLKEMKSSILTAMRIIVYFVALMYFGVRLVACDQGIVVCDKDTEELKEDVEDWRSRCLTNKGRNESNSKCCKDEKKYNQERIRSMTARCFHDGPYPEPYMLVSMMSEIHAIDLTTLDLTVVIRDLKNSRAIEVDTVDKKLYFENDETISRTNMDGTGVEVILENIDVFSMTLDWIGRRIFWTSANIRKIELVHLHEKERRTLVNTDSTIWDLAVDPVVGYLFWTQTSKVQRMNLVSKEIVTVVKKRYWGYRAIALYYKSNCVFWINTKTRTLSFSDYDGIGEKKIASGISRYYVLGIFGDLLFFERNGYINEMNVSCPNISRYIAGKKSYLVEQLKIVDHSKQPTGPCGSFAFYNKTNSSYSCHCEVGFKWDGKSCRDIDECLSLPCGSFSNISCVNTPGSYRCKNCSDGLIKELAYNTCYAYSELKVKLVKSKWSWNNKSGTVHIYHPTFGWGTVCRIHWDNTASDIVCRQLGFAGALTTRYDGHGGRGAILLDQVVCNGNETYIWDCQHSGWKNVDLLCSHRYDVVVDCY